MEKVFVGVDKFNMEEAFIEANANPDVMVANGKLYFDNEHCIDEAVEIMKKFIKKYEDTSF
ncbi:MAG: hypothetical protein A4E52_01781 [Pelotomaculum sp. PtaB.Bin013]|uniref:Uncharacterized protein n=1 Tax=Pelotomaculum isophthalicicum JI TaxID=947010 RepID=A0A9X4H712_9FIRM|nr:hypothetical protein [Pelotomaculum isophthalicicum]MDF9409548.1 hypothetical protein [Pelotomaculum isophthalicicum JI]OPX83713.1 MAG: hypothetical protein A4E52_01781 [Pelotomaculum sp. PtaB.Bin013]